MRSTVHLNLQHYSITTSHTSIVSALPATCQTPFYIYARRNFTTLLAWSAGCVWLSVNLSTLETRKVMDKCEERTLFIL